MGIRDSKNSGASFFLRNAWDTYARFYDVVHPRIIKSMGFFGDLSYEEFVEEFIKLARLKAGMSVLDVACGTGACFPALVKALGTKGDIVGVDISTEMLQRASKRAKQMGIPNVTFGETDAEKLSLEFDEESFDAVVSCNGLPNFLHPKRAIVEMAYVLRGGGRLALSTINRDKLEEHPVLRWAAKYPEGRFACKKEYGEMFRKLGFEKVKFYERGLMLIIITQKIAG